MAPAGQPRAAAAAAVQPDWSDLPPTLFEHVVARVIDLEPSTALPLLTVSTAFNRAACRALYEDLVIADDEHELARPRRRSPHEVLVRWPENYATYVRSLTLVGRPAHVDEDDESSYFSFLPRRRGRPLSLEQITALVASLESLEAFVWCTPRVPPAPLCATLAAATPGLSTLIIRITSGVTVQRGRSGSTASASPVASPRAASHELSALDALGISDDSGMQDDELRDAVDGSPSSASTLRWDAAGLHKLPCLRELSLAALSAEGARTFTRSLPFLAHLEHLTLDCAFVDDAMLAAVAAHCRGLLSSTMRTTGTKVTDKGITALLGGCAMLQRLELSECEGRLTRKLWGKLSELDALKSVRVVMNEVGPHHSWVSDHLDGIFELLAKASSGLESFALRRVVPAAALVQAEEHDGAHNAGFVPRVHPSMMPRPLPEKALELLKAHGGKLLDLELDFFVMSIDELKAVLSACPRLESLRIYLDAPLAKVLSLSAAFIPLTQLHLLEISLTEPHCPKSLVAVRHVAYGGISATTSGLLSPSGSSGATANSPPSRLSSLDPTLPELSPSSTSTSLFSVASSHEAATPINVSASPQSPRKMQRRMSGASGDDSSLTSAAAFAMPGVTGSVGAFDTSVPPKRDVRKLARRCASLQVLRWTGRLGKGEWRISNPGHVVEFYPAGVVPLAAGTLDEPAYDASLLRRRTSSTCALKPKPPISVNAMLSELEHDGGPPPLASLDTVLELGSHRATSESQHRGGEGKQEQGSSVSEQARARGPPPGLSLLNGPLLASAPKWSAVASSPAAVATSPVSRSPAATPSSLSSPTAKSRERRAPPTSESSARKSEAAQTSSATNRKMRREAQAANKKAGSKSK